MRCFYFFVATHCTGMQLNAATVASTAPDAHSLRHSTNAQDTSKRFLQTEECAWLTKDAKDFKAASTDPDAEIRNDGAHYYYGSCHDVDSTNFDALSDSIGNCSPQQSDYSYGSKGFSCYWDYHKTLMGCCLGDGMYVVFDM